VETYRSALDALGDATRRAIFESLRDGPRAVGELAATLPVSRPAVSQHLRVLREAGLVVGDQAGTRRLYRLAPDGLADVQAYLSTFWDVALAGFKVAAEATKGGAMSTQTTGLIVSKTIIVDASVGHAFAVFTERMADWWPLRTHSVGEEHAYAVTMEQREGGRLYESIEGGEESDWGRVLAWEPPSRVVLTWHPGRSAAEATELEVRFTPEGAATRVDLEHRGWERLGARGAATRDGYETGWDPVLAAYVAAV
jgi:DNA-binding transcriptional ArsR family regulator/uncharacterized protein YndB with AHSA1/START domain